MTAVDQARTDSGTAARTGAEIRPVPFSRLTLFEWRKQLDTRAVRWLFVVIALLTAGVLAVTAFVGDGDVSFETFVSNTSTPLTMLLPVVAILATTAEWSQRTALTTFTLEPRRQRVVGAKILTAVGSGAAFFAVVLGIAALAHLAVVVVRDATPDWVLGATTASMLMMLVLWMIQGVAFGLALQSTPAAIVVYLAVPTMVGVVAQIMASMGTWENVWPWIDLSTASMPFIAGPMMSMEVGGEQWARLVSAAAIWVALPLVIGMLRVQRGEIKTA